MKILTVIPCLYNGLTCKKAIDSVINESDVLLIDNGSELDVKQVLNQFELNYNVKLIRNEVNLYVTEAWNQGLNYFLNNNYDQLVIMNSDLILHPGWGNYLVDGQSVIPCDEETKEDKEVFEGTPGIFITMNRDMAKLCYPIPSQIRIWFNDLYLYTKMRKAGYKTIVKAGLIAIHWHNGSQTCLKLPEFQTIIEQDKIAWLEIEKTL